MKSSGMVAIASENLFEPTIRIKSKDGSQFISTKYDLQLENKIGAAKALIDFYKAVVDGL